MFDIGWTELLVIGIVALIVIGPKDLPEMFRTLGRFTAKARAMARDFSRAMEDAAKESGVSDITKDLKAVTNPRSFGMDKVKEAASKFESWDPMKSDDKDKAKKEWGPNTQALSEERAEAARKIHEHSARRTQERLDAEAAEAAAAAAKMDEVAAAKAAAKKPPTKKTAAANAKAKPAAKKAAPKSASAAKKAPAKKAPAKKASAAKSKPASAKSKKADT